MPCIPVAQKLLKNCRVTFLAVLHPFSSPFIKFRRDRTRATVDWIFGVNDHGAHLASADTDRDDPMHNKKRMLIESLERWWSKYT